MMIKAMLVALSVVIPANGLMAAVTERDFAPGMREAVAELVSSLSKAWEQGDGQAWGAAFVDDAYFSTWFGLRLESRDAIAEGHRFVFDEMYPGSVY